MNLKNQDKTQQDQQFLNEIKNLKIAADQRFQLKSKIPAIEIKDLTIDFGETLAVDTANITVYKGELVTLLGPSGSGKTTILNAIAGLLTPTSGRILFNGQEVTKYTPQQRKLGLVFQNYALYPHLNVYDNIAFPLTNDPKWKQKVFEKSLLARVNANSVVFAKNGAPEEAIKEYKSHLYNYLDVYKQLEMQYNASKSAIYAKLNQLKTDLVLVKAHKHAEIKNLTFNLLKIQKLVPSFARRLFNKIVFSLSKKNKELTEKQTSDNKNYQTNLNNFLDARTKYEEDVKKINIKTREEYKLLKAQLKAEKKAINSNVPVELSQDYEVGATKIVRTKAELTKLKKQISEFKKKTFSIFINFEKDLVNKYSLDLSKLSAEELKEYETFKADNITVREAINREVLRTAEKVEITKNLAKKPTKLSGGQQQRVAIARGIVRHPDILLMDEPLSNLDAKLRIQTRQWIRKIQTEIGITTVFVTHDQEEAMSISDRIICMSTGYVQQIGTPMELYNTPKNEFVASFLGMPEMNIFDADYNLETNQISVKGKVIIENFKNYDKNKIRVGIRAEHIREMGSGNFAGTITTLEHLGKDILAKVEVEELGQITTFLKEKQFYEIGEKVSFYFRPEKVHFFDIDTRERVEWFS